MHSRIARAAACCDGSLQSGHSWHATRRSHKGGRGPAGMGNEFELFRSSPCCAKRRSTSVVSRKGCQSLICRRRRSRPTSRSGSRSWIGCIRSCSRHSEPPTRCSELRPGSRLQPPLPSMAPRHASSRGERLKRFRQCDSTRPAHLGKLRSPSQHCAACATRYRFHDFCNARRSRALTRRRFDSEFVARRPQVRV